MRKLKVLLVLACATLAMSVVSAPASAQSGTATGKFAANAQPPYFPPPSLACDLTVDWDNGVAAPPAGPNQTINISNAATVPGTCPNLEITDGAGVLTTDGGSGWGYSSFSGYIKVLAFGSVICTYDASSNGLWVGDYVDLYSPSMPLTSGSALCPGSVPDARFWVTL